jgi:hypothetical protein
MSENNDFLNKARLQLDNLRQETDKCQDQADRADVGIRIEARRTVADIYGQIKAIELDLNTLESADNKPADDFKENLNDRFNNINDAIATVKEKLGQT